MVLDTHTHNMNHGVLLLYMCIGIGNTKGRVQEITPCFCCCSLALSVPWWWTDGRV